MSLLVESIKLLDGRFYNLKGHEQRMNHSLQLLFGSAKQVNLQEFFKSTHYPSHGLYKCRVLYDSGINDVEFVPYTPKSIKTLKLIEDSNIAYEHKYTNRSGLDKLYAQRGNCDDILIIKEGLVTDAFSANIVFKKDHTWVTPTSKLLSGTMRQSLLDRGLIFEEKITINDIRSYTSFKLINALLEFEGPELNVSNIIS